MLLYRSLLLHQSQINALFFEISDNVRVVQEFANSMNQAKEFALVLEETGKMLSHRNEAQAELEVLKAESERKEGDGELEYVNEPTNRFVL